MTVVPASSGGWRTPDALLRRKAAGQTLSERYSERMSVYDRQILLPTERSPSPVWSCLPTVILALVFFLVLGIGGVYAYRQAHQNRIYPGVTVLGLSVGRATRAEAEMALRAYVHNVRQQPLRVRVPDEVPPITLMALGLDAADEEILRLVDDAWWVGRDLPLGSWLMTQLGLLTRGYVVPGALTLDSEQAREVLQQLAEQLSREPVSATLRVTNSDAGFVSLIERSQPGRRLKVEETLLRLQRSLAGQLPTTLDLVLEELPVRVTEADLERPRAAVDHLLQSPLVLRAGDKTWSLEPDVLFSMLDTEALATEQAAPVARLREDKVRAFVAGVAAEANDPPGIPSLELRRRRDCAATGAARRGARRGSGGAPHHGAGAHRAAAAHTAHGDRASDAVRGSAGLASAAGRPTPHAAARAAPREPGMGLWRDRHCWIWRCSSLSSPRRRP